MKNIYVILFILIGFMAFIFFIIYLIERTGAKNKGYTKLFSKSQNTDTIVIDDSEYIKNQNNDENIPFHTRKSLQAEVEFLSIQFEKKCKSHKRT